MTDTHDRPLPDHVRQQLRADLRAIAAANSSRPAKPWLLPGAAAAAVAVVIGGASLVATHRPGASSTSGYVPPPAPAQTAPSRPGAATHPLSWNAVRTDPDSRLLVVTYLGTDAPCQGAVSATVQERAGAVVVALREQEPAPVYVTDSGGRTVAAACDLVGVSRSVAVRLSEPLGGRVVIDPAGRTDAGTRAVRHEAFDGTHLLTPTALPRGYVRGGEDAVAAEGDQMWSRYWSDSSVPPVITPAPAASAAAQGPQPTCNPAQRPTVLVQQHSGTASPPEGADWRTVDRVTIDGQSADLLTGTGGLGWRLTWRQPLAGQDVSLQTMPPCGDSKDFTEAEFLNIARSLRVAHD